MKRSRFTQCLAAAVLSTVIVASAWRLTAVSAAQTPVPTEAQRGEHLFATSCAGCHGPTGKGSAMGASLIDSSLVRHDKAGDLIAAVVHNGRPDKGMPPFPSIEPAQIADIAAFLHTRIALTDSVETAGPRGGYQLQNLLTGNAAQGKQFFNGPGGCAQCHSPNKDLAGVARKYRPVELEARFLYPVGAPATAIVTLPSGQIVKGTLQHLDAFNLALTDSEGHLRSWPLPGIQYTIADPMQAHLALLDRYTNKEVHDVFAYLETLQ